MTEAKGRKFSWGKVVLIGSLSLNLAIIGGVAGFFLRSDRLGERPYGSQVAAPYIHALSNKDRQVIRKTLKNSMGSIKMDKAARKERFMQISAALRADPFERAQIEVLMAQQHSNITRQISLAQNVWLEHISAMEPQERILYADRLDEYLARGARHRKSR